MFAPLALLVRCGLRSRNRSGGLRCGSFAPQRVVCPEKRSGCHQSRERCVRSTRRILLSSRKAKDKFLSRLPETLAADIATIPGVRQMNTGLMDMVDCEGAGPVGFLVQGWPAGQPLLKTIDLMEGRRLTLRDTDGIMLGSSLALKLNKKIGDELTLYDGPPTVKTVGIYRGKSVLEDGAAIVLLGSLQKWMHAEGTVNGFTVLLEHPDKPEDVERIKREIEKLGKNVDVFLPPQLYR